jgi:hypothetical protein
MEFCLGEYDDSRAAGVDPLKHHVKRGIARTASSS